MPAIPAFHFEQPEIRIVSEFTRQPGLGRRPVNPFGGMRAKPPAFAPAIDIRRTRSEERDSAIGEVHQNVDRAGLGGPSFAQDSEGPLYRGSP